MQSAIEMESLTATNSQSTSAIPENSSTIDPQPAYPRSVFRSHKSEHGKPSVIHAYCQHAIDNGHKECIWLGIQRGRRWIAKDIQLGVEEKPLGIYELRKLSGWWKRHSLFSAVGVKEIKVRMILSISRGFSLLCGELRIGRLISGLQICFLGFNEATNEVEIVPMDFDFTNEVRYINHALAEAYTTLEYKKCRVDVMGRPHDRTLKCGNGARDSKRRYTHCKAQLISDLEQQKEEYEWLPSMLEYFWQNGIGSKGVEFLRATGFIHSYE
jgi:hypothetical protein